MATPYKIRAVLRVLDGTTQPQVVPFKCWRLRLYVLNNGTNTVLDNVPLTDLAGPNGNVLEFGGVVVDGVPVVFEQVMTFTSSVNTKRTVILVQEYLEPLNR